MLCYLLTCRLRHTFCQFVTIITTSEFIAGHIRIVHRSVSPAGRVTIFAVFRGSSHDVLDMFVLYMIIIFHLYCMHMLNTLSGFAGDAHKSYIWTTLGHII